MELILVFVLLIFFSGFFSGTETAYFNLKTHRSSVSDRVTNLMNDSKQLLVSLLTGNTFVNIGIASLAAYITHKFAVQNNWSQTILVMVEVFVVSAVVLIFGEIFPKLLAIRHSEKFAERVYIPLKTIIIILKPITIIFHFITNLFTSMLPMKKEKNI